MTYTNRLRFAGSKPYEPEADRLPYPVFEALSQDPVYQRLAEVRWLVDQLEAETASDEAVPQETHAQVFDAIAACDAPLQVAVDVFVREWLTTEAAQLLEDWGLDEATIADAAVAYDIVLEEVAHA